MSPCHIVTSESESISNVVANVKVYDQSSFRQQINVKSMSVDVMVNVKVYELLALRNVSVMVCVHGERLHALGRCTSPRTTQCPPKYACDVEWHLWTRTLCRGWHSSGRRYHKRSNSRNTIKIQVMVQVNEIAGYTPTATIQSMQNQLRQLHGS